MRTLIYARFTNPVAYVDPGDSRIYGTTYTADYVDFDTLTEALVPLTMMYDDAQNTSPPQDFDYPGEFYAKCVGTTRHGYTADGAGGFTVQQDADSLSCGFVPAQPPTCSLAPLAYSLVLTATGATLTAQAQGAQGAVQYRLNNGPRQGSPVFYLAPGRHVLTALDTGVAGCTRSVALTVDAPPPPAPPAGAPERVDFVEQPLWYSVQAPAGADVVLELYAESAHGAEDFALVLPVRRRANAGGRVTFRLDQLLAPLLRAQVPPGSAGATVRCRQPLVNYFVRTTTVAPAGGLPPAGVISPLRTALRGALPAERRDVDYFQYRLDAFGQPPFLTWQPAGKVLTPEQPEWLFWLCPPDQPAAFTVRRSYVRTGFASSPLVVEDEAVALGGGRGPAGQLLAIPVRPRAGTDAVSVGLYAADGTALSPLATYAMTDPTPRTRYLHFTNSLGGFDTLRTEGKREGSLEASVDRYELPAQPGGPAPAPERQAFDVAAARKLRLATGWLTRAELAWLQELVLSREIWEWQAGGRLLLLDVVKRQVAHESDEGPLRGLLLEYDYAHAPTAYANLP